MLAAFSPIALVVSDERNLFPRRWPSRTRFLSLLILPLPTLVHDALRAGINQHRSIAYHSPSVYCCPVLRSLTSVVLLPSLFLSPLSLPPPVSKLSNDTLQEAVAAVLKGSAEKKRGFVETIELQIALKNYDPNKDKRFSGTVRLPVAPKQKFNIGIIGDAKHIEDAKKLGIVAYSQDDLKKLKKDKKLVKKLANSSRRLPRLRHSHSYDSSSARPRPQQGRQVPVRARSQRGHRREGGGTEGQHQVPAQEQEGAQPGRGSGQCQHDGGGDTDQHHSRCQLLRVAAQQELAAGQAHLHQEHHGPLAPRLRLLSGLW